MLPVILNIGLLWMMLPSYLRKDKEAQSCKFFVEERVEYF